MRFGMLPRYGGTQSGRGGGMCIRCGRRVGRLIRSVTRSGLRRRSGWTRSLCSTSPTPTTRPHASATKASTSKPFALRRLGPAPAHLPRPRSSHEGDMRLATRRAGQSHVPLVRVQPWGWRDGGGGGVGEAGGVWGGGCGVGASGDAVASGVPGGGVCVEVGCVLHAGAFREACAGVGESAGAGVWAGDRVRDWRVGVGGWIGVGGRRWRARHRWHRSAAELGGSTCTTGCRQRERRRAVTAPHRDGRPREVASGARRARPVCGRGDRGGVTVDSWHVMSSVVSVLAGCAIAVLIIGCLWPGEPAQRVPERKLSPYRTRRSQAVARRRVEFDKADQTSWTAWTCELPLAPLSIDDAHQAMRHHREHDCARKRAAFAALVEAGRITPDSRRYGRRGVVS